MREKVRVKVNVHEGNTIFPFPSLSELAHAQALSLPERQLRWD